MKLALLFISLSIPAITLATSPMPPDANDLYCEQVQPANGHVPGFQLQVSEQFKQGAREYFVAVKYDSSILPDFNFEGSQIFSATPTSKTDANRIESNLETGESFSSTLIASRFNQDLGTLDAYSAYRVSPSSKLVEIRLNTKGPGAKAVVLRFIQVGQSLDISVIGLASEELTLKESLAKDEEASKKNDYSSKRQVRTDFNVYDHKVTCNQESRYSHVTPRPNLIK